MLAKGWFSFRVYRTPQLTIVSTPTVFADEIVSHIWTVRNDAIFFKFYDPDKWKSRPTNHGKSNFHISGMNTFQILGEYTYPNTWESGAQIREIANFIKFPRLVACPVSTRGLLHVRQSRLLGRFCEIFSWLTG